MVYRGAQAARAKRLDQLLVELHAIDKAFRDHKIVFFKPLPHGDQNRFFQDQLMNVRLVLGSNRSGKTRLPPVAVVHAPLAHREAARW